MTLSFFSNFKQKMKERKERREQRKARKQAISARATWSYMSVGLRVGIVKNDEETTSPVERLRQTIEAMTYFDTALAHHTCPLCGGYLNEIWENVGPETRPHLDKIYCTQCEFATRPE